MGSLLLPLPVLAVILAALDAASVRAGLPWRAPDVRLFFHAYFLWALFGLVALVPAWGTLRLLERFTPRWPGSLAAARPWLVLLAWMVLPVVGESVLDRHTTLVGFGGLFAPRAWIELGAALLALLAALFVLGRTLGNLPGVRTASIGVGLAFGVGMLMPGRAPAVAAESAGTRPNLLLLVLDTCRSDRLEAYGHERPTSPGLAALAEESIVFEDSISVSTFTFTSHLSMLSGVYPETHGAHLLDMRFRPERAHSLALLLKAAGYRTGAFVGTDVLAGRTDMRAGFDVYDDQVDPPVCDTLAWKLVHAAQSLAAEFVPALRFNGRPHWIQDFQRPADEVLARTQAFIRRDDPRPWFAFVNLYDVHWPYVPEGDGRERLVRPYSGPVDGFLFRSNDWQPGYVMDEHDLRHVNDLYEGEILDLDARVTAFLDELELERGGTAVMVTADHGEGMGEEGTWNHDDVREVQVRVPLILRLPQPSPRGERSTMPVTGIDIAPTLLSLAGLEIPAEMEGQDLLAKGLDSMRERWIDDRDHVDPADYRCALYREGFKLVRFGRPPQERYELYELALDPGGFRDVQDQHPERFASMLARMQERGGGTTSAGELADSADALQALGYAGD